MPPVSRWCKAGSENKSSGWQAGRGDLKKCSNGGTADFAKFQNAGGPVMLLAAVVQQPQKLLGSSMYAILVHFNASSSRPPRLGSGRPTVQGLDS